MPDTQPVGGYRTHWEIELGKITGRGVAVKFTDNTTQTKWLNLTPKQFAMIKAALIIIEDYPDV